MGHGRILASSRLLLQVNTPCFLPIGSIKVSPQNKQVKEEKGKRQQKIIKGEEGEGKGGFGGGWV